jgi:hypothetical protein
MSTPRLNRDLRLLVAAKALMSTNLQVPFFALFLIRALHMSVPTALQVYACLGLLGGTLEIPTGWLADKVGYKTSMTAGSIFCVLGLSMYATSTHLGLWFISGAGVSYIGWSMVNGADSALAADICNADYPRDAAGPTYVHFEMQSARIGGLSMAGGSLLAALLVWQFGLSSIMWAQAAIYVPMLVCTVLAKTPPRTARPATPSAMSIAKSLKGRRQLMAIFAFAAVIGSVTNIMWKVLPLYYTSVHIAHHTLPTGGLGVLWALYLTSQYLVKPTHPGRLKQRFGQYGSFAILLALGTTCYLTLGLETSLAGLAAVFVSFWIMPMHRPRVLGLTRELSLPEERATIMSMLRSVSYITMSIAGLAISTVVRFEGLSTGLIFTGLVLGVFGTLSLKAMMTTGRVSAIDSLPVNPQSTMTPTQS